MYEVFQASATGMGQMIAGMAGIVAGVFVVGFILILMIPIIFPEGDE